MTAVKNTSMQKTITVRGTGRATTKPDCIHILFQLISRDSQYSRAIKFSVDNLATLKRALKTAGVDPGDLKTMDFSVETEKKYVNNHYVFDRHAVHHKFKLVLDMDMSKLGKVIEAVTQSCADPDMAIRFTVKDPTVIKDKLLSSAATNARSIAEALCKGTGSTLGELVSINYSWQEVDIYSETNMTPAPSGACRDGAAPPEFTPDDIEASDSVTFVWTIK